MEFEDANTRCYLFAEFYMETMERYQENKYMGMEDIEMKEYLQAFYQAKLTQYCQDRGIYHFCTCLFLIDALSTFFRNSCCSD
jgi:hypothetical protein